MRDFLSVY